MLTKTMEAFGWRTLDPVDWVLRKEDDLADHEVHEMFLTELRTGGIDVVWFGIDCSTFSRARDIPLAGSPPVRSEDYPDGLPNLPVPVEASISRANSMARFVAEACES